MKAAMAIKSSGGKELRKSQDYHFERGVGQMTWEKLIELEPRLKKLYENALECHEQAEGNKDFCANQIWFRELKPQLIELVGDFREEDGDTFLFTSQAYDMAYQTIYNALPDCKHERGFC